MTWFVYLLECQNGKIYTGITTDVQRRFHEHLKGTGAKFTRANPPVQILAFKHCMSRSEASSMEYHVKRLTPSQKRELGVIWKAKEKNNEC
jgi:putative endonuclease